MKLQQQLITVRLKKALRADAVPAAAAEGAAAPSDLLLLHGQRCCCCRRRRCCRATRSAVSCFGFPFKGARLDAGNSRHFAVYTSKSMSSGRDVRRSLLLSSRKGLTSSALPPRCRADPADTNAGETKQVCPPDRVMVK